MSQQLYAGLGIPLLASAARTTSSNSGNLKDTTTNLPIGDAVSLYLDVTALAGTGGAPRLDVWIDTSPDGGTTWLLAYKFTQVSSSTATYRIDTRTTGLGAGEAAAQTSVVSSTTGSVPTSTVLTRDFRIRWETTGSNSGLTSTFAVFAIVMPPGAGSRGC